ncbi:MULTISPECIES: hypothetical protein [unclassified Streptomyces]|uniref:Uncharacterized protein n=1 Tax=Streptomyces sp. R33 TaxID=3238629 RepID=A0AB39YDA4_9ACTN|nr:MULTISPECIES: hypothetical protein [unclassified Streptomyces]TDU80348.1 hypothetical protein EDD91_7186 [Streptomyces sp. KS 21]THA39719.1 hypothetical protein E6W17_08925 [Streptomyces sp. A1547]
MTEHKKHRPTTPPSKAPGESGDREARKEAEEAVMPGGHDREAGDALTPSPDAQRRAGKRARSGD